MGKVANRISCCWDGMCSVGNRITFGVWITKDRYAGDVGCGLDVIGWTSDLDGLPGG